MFHWEKGIFLTRPRLGIDVQRRLPHGFVSHAHFDHMAPHEITWCTPATRRLFLHRMGKRARKVNELPYRVPREFGNVRLTTYPAGHCLGSAMLLVEGIPTPCGEQSLLYTGDYKLGESATAEAAELPQADILIMESTFGRPEYQLPPRVEVVGQLIDLVQQILAAGRTPVIHAYQLGKSQEVTRLLTDAGVSVLQHPAIFEISEVYHQCGVELGEVELGNVELGNVELGNVGLGNVGLGNVASFDSALVPGRAVVTLPKSAKNFRLSGLIDPVSIAVTGWAVHQRTQVKWDVDHALPLSDHADFGELLETVERVGPRQTYCTHGPAEFITHLRNAGHEAFPAAGSFQSRFF